MKKSVFGVILVSSLVLNVGLLFFAYPHISNDTVHVSKEEAQQLQLETYPFLAGRIFRENKNDIFINFMPLRLALREYVAKQPEEISLYFEYLPSGSTIGVDDTQEIEMASLAKLPTVMAVYDKIANGQLSEDHVLTMEEKHINKLYGTFWEKGIGTKLSIREAVEKTLIDSDNTTYEMLYDLLSHDDKVRMFQQLDIRIELTGEVLTSYVSAKSYASILKSLYLSTYLSNEYSNKILDILTKSTVRENIPAGVDPGVPVAHKTGILEKIDGMDAKNDCGIVYMPKRPYILCILVHGEDDAHVRTHMERISQMIFTYLQTINK